MHLLSALKHSRQRRASCGEQLAPSLKPPPPSLNHAILVPQVPTATSQQMDDLFDILIESGGKSPRRDGRAQQFSERQRQKRSLVRQSAVSALTPAPPRGAMGREQCQESVKRGGGGEGVGPGPGPEVFNPPWQNWSEISTQRGCNECRDPPRLDAHPQFRSSLSASLLSPALLFVQLDSRLT